MKIMKFGGTSVGSGERMLHIGQIVKMFSEGQDVVVVVSAMNGVTDRLISLFQKYKSGNFPTALKEIRSLYSKHHRALKDLGLRKEDYIHVSKSLYHLFGDLTIYLSLCKKYDLLSYDYVISFGEKLSSHLLSAAMNKIGVLAKPMDASSIIVANNEFSNAKAILTNTKIKAKKTLLPLLSEHIVPVVTGFFAATKGGEIVTLGRGGSDYSATVLANALDADEVVLWKEVDGVFSSDPQKNDKARFYPELTYSEALALAKNGAKVLHPEAMKPVQSKEIVVWVKNTFKPDFIGTKIWKGAL